MLPFEERLPTQSPNRCPATRQAGARGAACVHIYAICSKPPRAECRMSWAPSLRTPPSTVTKVTRRPIRRRTEGRNSVDVPPLCWLHLLRLQPTPDLLNVYTVQSKRSTRLLDAAPTFPFSLPRSPIFFKRTFSRRVNFTEGLDARVGAVISKRSTGWRIKRIYPSCAA